VSDSTSPLAAFMAKMMPFTALLGIEAVAAGASEVRLRMAWQPSLCTSFGVLHGGTLMSLADSAAAWCAFLNVPHGAMTTTIEAKTNFIRAVRSGYVDAVAQPLHVGRTTIVMETELRDEPGRLVAKVIQTQAVIAPPPDSASVPGGLP
jgi:1,4-dihydroxy-2-naphthoyl-CoA hydrolase